jgi:large subunit ribosomal protein L28
MADLKRYDLVRRFKQMSKVCCVTGKKPSMGNSYAIRGIAKKKKGVGLKVTGIKKRRFLPNLVKKRFWFAEENRFITLRLSTNAMRTIDKTGLSTIVRQMRASGKTV